MPQQLVVLSYQREYRIVHCGSSHASAKNDSSLQMKVVASEEEAASYVAKRLCTDPTAAYLHVIIPSWEGLTQFASDQLPNAVRARDPYRNDVWDENQSIWVARPRVDYDSEWYQELETLDIEADEMSARIHQIVQQKLKDADTPTALLKKPVTE